jgi:RNA polymerase sigma-70 factor, ECF subfamily
MIAEMVVATLDEEAPELPATDPILLAAIRAVQDGDSRAFEHIMIATERRVALLSWRILGDADEVKDAVQEVFLRAYRHLRRFDLRRPFMAWLFRITVNVCRDHVARRKRRGELFVDLGDHDAVAPLAAPDEGIAAREELALLTRAVDSLPEKERLALILRDIEEIPTAEVARILGSRPATVRVQVSSARSKIRALMHGWSKEKTK